MQHKELLIKTEIIMHDKCRVHKEVKMKTIWICSMSENNAFNENE